MSSSVRVKRPDDVPQIDGRKVEGEQEYGGGEAPEIYWLLAPPCPVIDGLYFANPCDASYWVRTASFSGPAQVPVNGGELPHM